MRWVRGIGLLLLLVATACAAHAPPAERPMAADRWTPLSWEERHDRMTWLVHPNMARLFQSHDGKAAADMTCRTCHGKDAEEVAYAMPHALPALDPAHMPDPSLPIVRFMTDEVTPTMADLLGVDRRSFNCFNCHRTGGRRTARGPVLDARDRKP